MKNISVYLLWHTDVEGDEKLIGVYEKHSEASAAIKRMRNNAGQPDPPYFPSAK